MRHARDEDLDQLEELLIELRALDALTEKARGVFYLRSRAFLHFHADPSGMFADVRTDSAMDFLRVRVSTKAEQRRLLTSVRRAFAPRESKRHAS